MNGVEQGDAIAVPTEVIGSGLCATGGDPRRASALGIAELGASSIWNLFVLVRMAKVVPFNN